MSGSCSNATLEQINIYKENNPSFYIDPDNIMNNQTYLKQFLIGLKKMKQNHHWCIHHLKAKVTEKQSQYGQEVLADKIEVFFEKLSKKLVEDNFGRFISAGGNLRRCDKGLGVQELKIGEEISRGSSSMVSSSWAKTNFSHS